MIKGGLKWITNRFSNKALGEMLEAVARITFWCLCTGVGRIKVMCHGKARVTDGGRAAAALPLGILTHQHGHGEAKGLRNTRGCTCIFMKYMTLKKS